MPYNQEITSHPKFNSVNFERPLDRLNEKISSGITFCQSLKEITPVEFADRSQLAAIAIEALETFPAIDEYGGRLGFTPHGTAEIVMQRLAGDFFILDHFVTFASRNEKACGSSGSIVEALDAQRVRFIDRVSDVSPLSASLLAGFWSEQTREKNAAVLGTTASLVIEKYCAVLENALEAVAQIDTFFNNLQRRIADSDVSRKLIHAWNTDMIRPIVEATSYSLALAMAALEKGHDTGATWFAPFFSVSDIREDAKKFAGELRNYSQHEIVPGKLLKFYGIDVSDLASRRQLIEQPTVPVPVLIGAGDVGVYLNWARNAFKKLNEVAIQDRAHDRQFDGNGAKLGFRKNIDMVFRGRSDSHGQARVGISWSGDIGNLSIRIDQEPDGIALDIGQTNALEFLTQARESQSAHRNVIAKYNRGRRELAAHGVPGNKPGALEHERERLSKLSGKINFFSNPAFADGQEIANFSAILGGVGRLIGTRGEESHGHHIRESLYRLNGAIPNFTGFVDDLGSVFGVNAGSTKK